MIQDPVAVAGTLLAVVGAVYWAAGHPIIGRLFKVVPLIVFAYFVPTLLSNTGILPLESPAYTFIRRVLLPASLLLITLSVDIPAIAQLGPKVLYMFFGATASVFLGSLVAYGSAGWLIPDGLHEQAWRGLAALCGSWIGGGANFVAVGESLRASQTIMGLMVVVDVAVANVWMAVLLWFAGREHALDDRIGADRSAVDTLRRKIEAYQLQVARPVTGPDLIQLGALSIGGTALCTAMASHLPDIGTIINGFTWVVILITAVGVALSFTPVRNLEGAGASALGTAFLYMLIATIGAQGDFREVVNAPALVVVGAVWMLFHAGFMLALRRLIKAPIFFLAVGSQANIGAAASAPIVASAFHPALATVGVMLAILGYVLGTYVALIDAVLLEWMYRLMFAAR